MAFRRPSVKRKTTAAIMLTSVVVLVLTVAAFTLYDLATYRQNLAHSLSATAAVIADHSVPSLALRDTKDAGAILASLRADPRIAEAALYDRQGNLFVRYPAGAGVNDFPSAPDLGGYRYEAGRLLLFEPVTENGARLGTLYLKSSLHPLFGRLRAYSGIALLVLLGSMLVALALSNALQRRITRPILALAEVAKAVSVRGDYSLRAPRTTRDETGLLTAAFNEMLARIEAQTEALQQTEKTRAFLAAIVESSDDAVAGKDLESRVVSWNAGAERMFGYSAEEMLGQPITRLQSPERPDEEARIIEQVRRGGLRHYETVRLHKDGHPIEVSLTVSPIKNASGEVIGISSIARDITERKQAQASVQREHYLLRTLVDLIPDPIYVRDDQDRFLVANAAHARLMGLRSPEEMLGKTDDDFHSAAAAQEFRADDQRVLAGETILNKEELVAFPAGGERVLLTTKVPFKDSNGAVVGMVGVGRDITERKRAEEQILLLNTELEQRVRERTAELSAANKELESFTYSVAHDLRAPLRHIDAFSKILEEDCAGVLPLEGAHYLQNIRKSTGKMSLLVDDLLNLARVGRQELRRQPTPLSGLVDEVLADLKDETAGRQLEWHIDPLPAIECDPGLMKLVFTNLLSNAVKYTRPRAVAVIEVGYRKANGNTAVFVRDNGVGFNMKYADKLFGVFQRFHRAEEFEGTGVGLATVDRIVRKHGGHIWAEAAVDKGATFYFTVAGLGQAQEQEHMAV